MLPNLTTLSAIGFILLVAILLYRDRRNVERDGILFFRRTQRGIKLLDSIASLSPRFWRVISDIWIVMGWGSMIVMGYVLLQNTFSLLFTSNTESSLGLVLPSLSAATSFSSGVLSIPFWYWMIGVGTVLIIHEGMHGVVGRNEKFRIKSVGLLLLGFIPGAFVEPEGEGMLPDRKKQKKKEDGDGSGYPWQGRSRRSQMRVIAAGSGSNIFFGLLVLLLAIGLGLGASAAALVGPFVLKVQDVENGSAAALAGLPVGSTIQTLDGFNFTSDGEFRQLLSAKEPGDSLAIGTDRGVYVATLQGKRLGFTPSLLDMAVAVGVYVDPSVLGAIEPYFGEEVNQLRRVWLNSLQGREVFRVGDVPERAYIGVVLDVASEVSRPFLFSVLVFFDGLLRHMVLLQIGIGVANMIPAKPLDGGYQLEMTLEAIFGKKEWVRRLSSVIGKVFLGLLVFAILFIILRQLVPGI